MRKLVTADAVVTGDGVIGDSILMVGGKVAAVGRRSDLSRPGIVEEAYPGTTIIPGMRDAHFHLVPYAALLGGCSLKAAADMDDLRRRLTAYATSLPDHEPVVATRLDDENLRERRLPNRKDLDAAVSDRPVVVYRYCGHIAVANTMALGTSGITVDTRDPDGGTIDKDPDGRPTGILRETAVRLVSAALARAPQLGEEALLVALRGLAGLGITSIGAMIGYGERPFEQLESELALWKRVASRLPIKVHGFVVADTPSRLEESARMLTGAGTRLRWLGVKRFADGSLGGHTAAMKAPFADVETTGTYRLTRSDKEVARKSIELGGMVAIHAIGDRAVDGVLDVFEQLIAGGAKPADLRMEHVSVIDPSLLERFASLGVSAVVQPAFLASEAEWVENRVGPNRTTWLYPFRSMLESGVPIAGSSDCPIEPPQPLWGMAAAMDRLGINPEQQLTAMQALALFTSGAARALREPNPLSERSAADFVVLDTDPSMATAEEVRHAQVLVTYVDGDAVEVDRSLPVWVD